MAKNDDLKTANLEFYRAIETATIERMDKVWLHEDSVRCVHPGWDLIVGWPRVRESWERIFASEQKMRISATEIFAFVSEEMAWVSCIENITVFQETSFDTVQAAATNLFVWRDDKWLMMHHHASPIPMILPDGTSETIQ
jgi:hypothetical protein